VLALESASLPMLSPGLVERAGHYPANAARSPASIFSAASSYMPGITWLYVSKLMPIEA
jgi:hypothetical protein